MSDRTKTIDALGLPPLPPLPDKREHATATGETERTKKARRDVLASLVAHVDHDTDTAWFRCAGCAAKTAWWTNDNEKRSGPAWGRYETGDTTRVHVKKKTGKHVIFTVPITVAGRVCGTCARDLPGFRRTAEPAVTEIPKMKGQG